MHIINICRATHGQTFRRPTHAGAVIPDSLIKPALGEIDKSDLPDPVLIHVVTKYTWAGIMLLPHRKPG